jgi:hypothetical protein
LNGQVAKVKEQTHSGVTLASGGVTGEVSALDSLSPGSDEVDLGDVLSRQQIGDAYLLINPGQRNDVPVGRHDRDVGITKSSGSIRVGARVAIDLELAIDEVDDPIISDARPGITVCFDSAVVR